MNTNKFNFWALFWLILLLATISIFSKRNAVKTNENAVKTNTVVVYVPNGSENLNWSVFIEALCWIESEDNPKAVGNNNDVGVLQITPVLLEEVNRLLSVSGSSKSYTLEDRYDRGKSIEMFNIIQNAYNPDKCPHWALKLWNPRAGWEYHIKVFAMYKELMKLKEEE